MRIIDNEVDTRETTFLKNKDFYEDLHAEQTKQM